MKTIISLVALLVTSFCSFGQNSTVLPLPNPLPASLPIQDEQTIRNWIVSTNFNAVTNSQTLAMFGEHLYYQVGTNFPDVWTALPAPGFPSYQAYIDSIARNGKVLCAMLQTNKDYDPTTPIWLISTIGFLVDNGPAFTGMFWDTNLGTLSQISSNTFEQALTVNQSPQVEYVVVKIPGLSRVKIEVDSPQPSWYVWDNGKVTKTLTWDQYRPWNQADQTSADYLVLSRWYIAGPYHTRITVTAGSATTTYTEYGDILRQPVLTMKSRDELVVSRARGSYVTILGSDDLVKWSQVANLDQADPTLDLVHVSIPSFAGHKFYRGTFH